MHVFSQVLQCRWALLSLPKWSFLFLKASPRHSGRLTLSGQGGLVDASHLKLCGKTYVESLFEITHVGELLWIYRRVRKEHGEIPDVEQHGDGIAGICWGELRCLLLREVRSVEAGFAAALASRRVESDKRRDEMAREVYMQ